MSTFRLKSEVEPKNFKVQVRLSKQEFAVLQNKAALFTEGNVSQWIRAALKNYMPKKTDLEPVKLRP